MRTVIVALGNHSLREARSAARRFLDRTNGASALEAAKTRSRTVPAAALKIERARMREKIKGTRRLREVLLSQVDDLRDAIKRALRLKEDDGSQAVQTQQILDRVNAALSIVDPTALAAAIYAIQQDLYQAGIASAATELGLSFEVKPQRAIDALYRYTLQFSRNVVDRELVAVKDALLAGIDAGESTPEIAQRVLNAIDDGIHILDHNGDLHLTDGMPVLSRVSGKVTRVIPSDSWAEMVARTEVTRALTAGVYDAYRAAGVQYIMWVSAEDERTCPLCQDLDGEVVKFGEEFDDAFDGAPAHPSCRCTTVSADAPDESGDESAPSEES